MTEVETVVRELMSGIQSSRVYFPGHLRVTACAEGVLVAVRLLQNIQRFRQIEGGSHRQGMVTPAPEPLPDTCPESLLLIIVVM